MSESQRAVEQVHLRILGQGREAVERFYDRLREIGIPPTPRDRSDCLYAPNPVVVHRDFVDLVLRDLDAFCRARREEIRDADDLLAVAPSSWIGRAADRGLATRLIERLRTEDPFACLDVFPVEGIDGLEPAYLEWQTFCAYPVTMLHVLDALRTSFPGIEDAGGGFSHERGETLESLRDRVLACILRGVEDDPRQGVIVDWEPAAQETRHEFELSARVTGGAERGLGVIDPREVVYSEGKPCYRRDGKLVPIRAAFGRLVPDDLIDRLFPALRGEERETVPRFLCESEHVSWRLHPLDFLYGTKGDFHRFRTRGLSPFLPDCREVTADFAEELRERGVDRLLGWVQKPVESHSGRGVVLAPRPEELLPGALLQRTIRAAACHPTLDGPRTPEIRVMGLPGADGRLFCGGIFTRVKASDAFLSNASVVAHAGVPGTGEGYGLFAG